jgi:cell division protein FtsW
MLAKHQKDFKPALIPILLWCAVICGIIAMTNFSTAALLFFTCLLVMFIGRMPIKYLMLYVLIGAMAGSLALFVGQRGKTVVSRVTSYWESTQTAMPDQSKYSNIAIATGGALGKGWGQSEQRNFLPLAYSDFIYAIIIEEYGLAGGMLVLVLYLILLFRGMRAVQTSTHLFGSLLSAGLSFALILQAIINMAVATGVIPITGLPLPLVSLGGSSLLFTGIAFGMILSVSKGDKIMQEEALANTQKEIVIA